jgi:hypothetical protein
MFAPDQPVQPTAAASQDEYVRLSTTMLRQIQGGDLTGARRTSEQILAAYPGHPTALAFQRTIDAHFAEAGARTGPSATASDGGEEEDDEELDGEEEEGEEEEEEVQEEDSAGSGADSSIDEQHDDADDALRSIGLSAAQRAIVLAAVANRQPSGSAAVANPDGPRASGVPVQLPSSKAPRGGGTDAERNGTANKRSGKTTAPRPPAAGASASRPRAAAPGSARTAGGSGAAAAASLRERAAAARSAPTTASPNATAARGDANDDDIDAQMTALEADVAATVAATLRDRR